VRIFVLYSNGEREKEESREARELVYKYTDKFTARNAASISLSLSRSIRKREEAENYLLRAHGLPRNVSLALVFASLQHSKMTKMQLISVPLVPSSMDICLQRTQHNKHAQLVQDTINLNVVKKDIHNVAEYL
jgi:hypothetical protein